MSEVSVQTLSSEVVVSTVLAHLNHGQIEDAVAAFASDFRFKDNGIGLDFAEKEQLTEFFRKARELYPDYFVRTDGKLVSGDDVIIQWTLQFTITEPFYGGLTRSLPMSISGVSIVRTTAGKIADWEDYYDGLTSRRTALGAHFMEWIEY
jgi:SnoaL-like polyketide cyclase